MSARLDLIVDTNAPRQDRLLANYTQPGTILLSDLVRNDKVLAFSVQPVTVNPPGSDTLYSADYEATDTFKVGLGDIDEPPSSGTVDLQVGATTSGLSGLSYAITAAALTTALNAALTTEGDPLCLVTLIEEGVYQIDAVTNGLIATGLFAVASSAQLQPPTDAFFIEQSLGGVSSKYQVLFVMRQSPTAYAEPATALTAAGVTISTTQAGSGSANKIQKISFDAPQTYGGTYRIDGVANAVTSTCCVAKPTISQTVLGQLLTGHPQIHYRQNGIPDNIAVTKSGADFFVEFIGTLGLSNSPTLSVTNIDLLAPIGRAGTINLNTISLYRRSLLAAGDTFTQKFSIQRTRASGEVRTLFLGAMTIRKDLIDVASMIPTPRPDYYTATQVNLQFINSGPAFGITSLVGGTSANLDNIAAEDAMRGRTVIVDDATYGYGSWQLANSTAAHDPATGYVRPTNYNASTNHNVWIRRT